MSVKFDFPLLHMQSAIDDTLKKATVATLKGMADDIEPYVPYKTGELNNSCTIDERTLSLVWDTDYAEYVYDMPKDANFTRTVHPQATSEWTKEALYINLDKWVEDIKRDFSRRWK